MLTSMRIPMLVVAALCLVSSLATSHLASAAEGDAKPFDPKYLAVPNAQASFIAMDGSCYNCHRATKPNLAMHRERGTLKRITLEETNRWRDLDFHDQAGIALTTPRAKAMGELLGYDVAKSTQCLSCHSGHQKIAERKSAPPELTAPDDELVMKHGVSCQACHGPASNWETPHRAALEKDKDWWKKSSAEKYALGLLDIRHPQTRAQVCLSCHLGSSSEGKIVTHAMYAAGHPPLQTFEVESFMAAMPYHGILLEKKTADSPDSHKDWYRAGDFYRTRSVLTASIVALRMQVQLVLDEATWSLNADANAVDAKAGGNTHRAQWPELALFNCASCHHELAADRPRPDRSASAAPGRPMLRSWPTVLYDVALKGSGIQDNEPILKPLESAMSRNPFGRASEVRDAARAVAERLDKELAEFERRPIDRAAALKYLEAIATVGLARPVHYEDARQLAAAAQVIVRELQQPAGSDAPLEPIAQAVAALDAEVGLEFPAKTPKTPEQLENNPDVVVYSAALLKAGSKTLDRAHSYDERVFRRRLEVLKSALAPKS